MELLGIVCLSKRTSKKFIEIKNVVVSSVIVKYVDGIIAVGNSCGRGHIKYLRLLKS